MADAAPPDLAGRIVAARTFEMVRELADAAFYSRLCDLQNSTAFDLLAREHDRGATPRLAVAFVDLSGFKAINDRYGHDAGDAAIKVAGTGLREIAGNVDGHAYHVGGDEFVVVVPTSQVDHFLDLARTSLRTFEVPFEREPFSVAVSVGVAPATEDAVLDVIRARAESACRLAKARQVDGPLVWREDDVGDSLVDRRWRCAGCGATVSLLFPAARRADEAGFCCPNCKALLPD